MATTTVPIPAQTIAAGQTVFGPVATGVGHNGFTMALEIGAVVDPCTLAMQYAADGVTFVTLSTEGPFTAASAVNRDGTPMVPAILSWSPNIGSTAAGPNLTTAISKVQIVISNTTAFHTNGGTLTVT